MYESGAEGSMEHILVLQKQAQLEQAVPGLAQRRQRLQACIDLLVENYRALCRAVSEDYGHRSEHLTLGEIQGTLANLKYTYKHLGKWMRPERRPTQFPLNLLGARSFVEYQPKGVVGVVSPWNFPVKLSLVPMGEALATGNRQIMVCERGASFGYNTLISDMRGLAIMRDTGCPVVFDATHSVQQPGGRGTSSRSWRRPIARPAWRRSCSTRRPLSACASARCAVASAAPSTKRPEDSSSRSIASSAVTIGLRVNAKAIAVPTPTVDVPEAMAAAVAGMSCINPMAPFSETA